MESETDDGSSSSSNFPERPTETELAANKRALLEIEHLKGKISDRELDSLARCQIGIQTFFQSIRRT